MGPLNTKRVSRHIWALRMAQECATLGARSRTIEFVTGLASTEVRRLLFPDRAPPGRAPASPDWYHGTTLLSRAEASIFLSIYRRIRDLGFGPANALIGGYKHYLHVSSTDPRINFDRAFDLASHVDGVWVASGSSLKVVTCPTCSSEYAASLGGASGSARDCPFCKLIKRYPRDAALQASLPRKVIDIPAKDIALSRLLTGSRRRVEGSGGRGTHTQEGADRRQSSRTERVKRE